MGRQSGRAVRTRGVRAAAALCVTVTAALLLSGCTGRFLDVPLDSTHIAKCPSTTVPYFVASIPEHAPVPCDIVGETLVFPNGWETIAPSQDGNGQEGGECELCANKTGIPTDHQYALLNFGTYGMIAGELNPHTCRSTWWGTQEGLARYWAAFGKHIQDDTGGKCKGS